MAARKRRNDGYGRTTEYIGTSKFLDHEGVMATSAERRASQHIKRTRWGAVLLGVLFMLIGGYWLITNLSGWFTDDVLWWPVGFLLGGFLLIGFGREGDSFLPR